MEQRNLLKNFQIKDCGDWKNV